MPRARHNPRLPRPPKELSDDQVPRTRPGAGYRDVLADDRQKREAAAARYRREYEFCLAPREEQILSLLALGYTQPETARRLGISVNTVKTYVKSACWLLGARNTTHAVYLAERRGLLPERSDSDRPDGR